jgi:hypothetical protein
MEEAAYVMKEEIMRKLLLSVACLLALGGSGWAHETHGAFSCVGVVTAERGALTIGEVEEDGTPIIGCLVDDAALVRAVLRTCREGSVCEVSARGVIGNGGHRLIERVLGARRIRGSEPGFD